MDYDLVFAIFLNTVGVLAGVMLTTYSVKTFAETFDKKKKSDF